MANPAAQMTNAAFIHCITVKHYFSPHLNFAIVLCIKFAAF